jgi:hypothetical protein
MTPAIAASFKPEEPWSMDDVKDLVRSVTNALMARLDDHDILVKLNTRSELTFTRVDELVTSIERKQESLDSRVDKLEQMRSMIYGAAFVLGLIGSALGSLIGYIFRGGK